MNDPSRQNALFLASVLIVFMGALVLSIIWPDTLLRIGYAHSLLMSGPGGLERIESSVSHTDVYRHFNDSVNVVTFTDGSRLFTHNGYTSTHFTNKGQGVLRETIIGVAPYLFSEKTDRALQIGLGGGITAGALGHLYDETTVVEINPAVIDMLPQFSEENLHVLDNPNVEIFVQDGVLTLYNTEKQYDLIVNSVPSPTYYSASKLWTKDVFSLISSRLAPGGVYSGWFGIRLGSDGVKTLFKTFEESFVDCRYVLLNIAYFNVICSNEELEVQRMPTDMEFPAVVRDQFSTHALPTPISQFILDLSIPLSFDRFDDEEVDINTLDHPVLEFQTAPTYVLSFRPDSLEQFFDAVRDTSNRDISATERTRRCESKSIVVPNSTLSVFDPGCDGVVVK